MSILVTHMLVSEFIPNELDTLASDLSLTPYPWPETLETTLGNGRPFIFWTTEEDKWGHVLWAIYRQERGGTKLYVHND
jgi:hypothetical protein